MKKLYNKIVGLWNKYLAKLIAILYPDPDRKRYLILLLFTITLVVVYSIFYQFKIKDVLPYEVKGKISDFTLRSSSGAGRTSGRSTNYYFKVEGYKATFWTSDVNFFGNMNAKKLKVGNYIELGIDKDDVYKLQIDEDKYSLRLEPIGLKINGIEEVKVYQSIFDIAYTDYLYISIPVVFYYLGSILFIVGDLFRYNRRRKEKKLANK